VPGRTGKRAKAQSPCLRCGKRIEGGFNREKNGDYQEECWWAMREDLKKKEGKTP
jgi:hypothetical protein